MLGEALGFGEFFGRVHVPKGKPRRIEARHFPHRQFADFDLREPRDDLPLIRLDGGLDGRDARGAAVDGVERLVALVRSRDDHVRFLLDHEAGRGFEERRAGKGHVAGRDRDDRGRGGGERGVESAQRAATRHEVRDEAQTEEGVIVGMIRGHEDFIRNRGETLDYALNERASEKKFEGFVFAHARRLSAGLDHEAEHETYYTHGKPCSDDFNRQND